MLGTLFVIVVALILAIIIDGKKPETSKDTNKVATPSATLAPTQSGGFNGGIAPKPTPQTQVGGTTNSSTTIINNPPAPTQATQQPQPTPTPQQGILPIPLPTIGGLNL